MAPVSHQSRSRSLVVPVALSGLIGLSAVIGAVVPTAAEASSQPFDTPTSIAAVGTTLFVTNSASNSVSEIDATSGAHVGYLTGSPYNFNAPSAILLAHGALWVANASGNSVTELSNSGTYLGTTTGISDPVALAATPSTLYVLQANGGVTSIHTATARVANTYTATISGEGSTGIAVSGGKVFVANHAGNTVTVLNASTLRLDTILSNASYKFNAPTGVTAQGKNIWVTEQGSSSITELSAGSLQVVQVIDSEYLPDVGAVTYGDGYVFTVSPPGTSPMVSQITPTLKSDPNADNDVNWMMCNTNAAYYFDNPQALAVVGNDLWVVNEGGTPGVVGGNSLTEMSASSGALIQVVV